MLCYVKFAMAGGVRKVFTFLFKELLVSVWVLLAYSWVTFIRVFLFLQHTLC